MIGVLKLDEYHALPVLVKSDTSSREGKESLFICFETYPSMLSTGQGEAPVSETYITLQDSSKHHCKNRVTPMIVEIYCHSFQSESCAHIYSSSCCREYLAIVPPSLPLLPLLGTHTQWQRPPYLTKAKIIQP